jgi:FkbM family methyltransferase
LLRTRQRLYALNVESNLRWQGREPFLTMEFTSQHGEDLLAWDPFGGQTSGFFIEAGAFDGHRFSVTYPFEAAGWTGLLVEPLPSSCARCAELRTRSRVVNAALSHRDLPAHETDFTIVADEYGGMLSHLPGTGYPALAPAASTRTIRVPLTNLNTLLADHRGEIDLLVLDVEGAEANALQGFDLERFRPRLMFIESGQDDLLRQRVTAHSYLFAGKLETNLLFIRNDRGEMIERVRWMSH